MSTPVKKRIEVYSHFELICASEINSNAGTSEAVLMQPVCVSGIRGSITVRNAGSVAATIRTYVSNYSNPGTPITASNNWFLIDERSLTAGTKDIIRFTGAYKHVCITGATSSGSTSIILMPYFSMGAI